MKRYFALLLTFVLTFTLYLPVNTHANVVFNDVPTSHGQYGDIMYLLDTGVISSVSKNFGVNDIVTREEVAVMVAKAIGLDGTPRATKFSDVPESNKNSGYIQSAVDAGIIYGISDTTFGPNQKVTRGQMAAFIARAYNLPNGNTSFKDVPKGHFAYDAVQQLVAAGIASGYEDGTFKPGNNLTRAHISAFLARSMKYAGGEPTTPPTPSAPTTKEMQVHFIDVGQGDAILIESPNGETMLVDGGVKEAGDDLVAYLQSEKVNELDYVVATHPDADHIGGLIDVLAAYQVNNFVNSGKVHTTETYGELLTAVKNEDTNYIQPKIGDSINLDSSLKVQVLHVDPNAEENNDASIVLKVTYNNVSFLLTGDIGSEVESVIASKFNVGSTILKAAHHGSSTSSSLSFLQKVKPQATILSYEKDNSYGHPHDEVVNNLKAVGSKVYSTAQDGTITVTTNGSLFNIDAKEFKVETTTSPTPKPEPQPEPKPDPKPQPTPTKPVEEVKSYKNCTELRKDYPNGVSSDHPAYAKKHDGDGDGWACEPPRK